MSPASRPPCARRWPTSAETFRSTASTSGPWTRRQSTRSPRVGSRTVTTTSATFQFTHALVRETVLDRLSATRRAIHHARVAEALERLYAPSLKRVRTRLAHHCLAAGRAVKPTVTVGHAVAAARAAIDTY